MLVAIGYALSLDADAGKGGGAPASLLGSNDGADVEAPLLPGDGGAPRREREHIADLPLPNMVRVHESYMKVKSHNRSLIRNLTKPVNRSACKSFGDGGDPRREHIADLPLPNMARHRMNMKCQPIKIVHTDLHSPRAWGTSPTCFCPTWCGNLRAAAAASCTTAHMSTMRGPACDCWQG